MLILCGIVLFGIGAWFGGATWMWVDELSVRAAACYAVCFIFSTVGIICIVQ